MSTINTSLFVAFNELFSLTSVPFLSYLLGINSRGFCFLERRQEKHKVWLYERPVLRRLCVRTVFKMREKRDHVCVRSVFEMQKKRSHELGLLAYLVVVRFSVRTWKIRLVVFGEFIWSFCSWFRSFLKLKLVVG